MKETMQNIIKGNLQFIYKSIVFPKWKWLFEDSWVSFYFLLYQFKILSNIIEFEIVSYA